MKTPLRLLLAGLLLVAAVPGAAQNASRIAESTEEVVLENGMRLLLVNRPGQPTIGAGWVAHVGSANEQPGITGISHLFEHMMFKGSNRIGTADAARDQEIRDQLDAVREEMFAEERRIRDRVRKGEGNSVSDPELKTERLSQLEDQFTALLAEQKSVLRKDEFDVIYTEQGGISMNAFTNSDMTVYFIKVPKNKLELWFWMESERLTAPVFREFYSERDVVYEERRMRTESTPTGAQNEVFNSLFWRGHPYGWPTVGWPSDISAITREQAEAFFDIYYAPNNITAALVGDFDRDEVVALAEKYFAPIPKGRAEPPDVITLAMPLLGDFTYRAEVDAAPSALVTWHTTSFGGVDDPALQVLASVLSGKTGRLYKRMVLGDQIATSVRASADSLKYDGTFDVTAQGKKGITPDQLREVLLEEVEKIKAEGITELEMQKVRNQLSAEKFRRLDDAFFLMIQLLYYDGLSNWRDMDTYFERVLAVTRDEVQAAANQYLVADSRASRLYTRKASDEPEDPALAAFSDEQRQMLATMQQQLAGVPPDRIPDVIGQLEAARANAPEEAAAVIDYVIATLTAEGGE